MIGGGNRPPPSASVTTVLVLRTGKDPSRLTFLAAGAEAKEAGL